MATNKPRRKTYSDEFKEFLVQEAEISGRSIASIARDNGINQNLLHNWKREKKPNKSKLTPAVNNGEKHLVDYIRQPDGKSLGIPGQVI